MKTNTKVLMCLLCMFFMPACADGEWEYVASMPKQIYGHDATLGPDGKIYVMGGFVWYMHNGKYSNIVYDPEKDKWTVLMPVPGWVRTDKNLLMIFDSKKNIWDWVEVVDGEKDLFKNFDPKTKSYKLEKIVVSPEKIRNTNLQRTGDGVAIVTGKDGFIYWTGGEGQWPGAEEDIVLHYDPKTGQWPEAVVKMSSLSPYSMAIGTVFKTDVPPMNERRIDHETVVTSDGKIFALGGRQWNLVPSTPGYVPGKQFSVLDSVECYDPKTNKWEYRKPLPVKRYLFAAVVGPDDKIYVFGGSTAKPRDPLKRILNSTDVYDPETDQWSSGTPMPKPRDAHAGVLGPDGKIYILGGCGDKGKKPPPAKDVFIYEPQKDTWTKGPQMNLPRASLAAVATPDGRIYAIGGTDVGAYDTQDTINIILPKKKELYTGRVQDTVEVLDIF